MNRAVAFILITMLIDAMGIGLILPVMPNLIREVTGGDLSQAAVWGGVLATAFAVMQFLFGPLLGNLSDRFGRRPVILVSLAVLAVDYLVMGLAHAIWLLLIVRVVGGIAAATQATANAFMADISTQDEKAARFGLIGAAFGVGFVLGPIIGGLLGEYGTRAPFYAAAALAFANLAFGFLVLPETLRRARPFEWRRANPLSAFRHVGALPGLGRLLVLICLYEFAFIVYPATWAYFGAERFGWSPGMIGLSLAAFGVSMAVVQGALIRPLMAWLGERGTILYGICFNVFAFVVLGFVESGTLALLFTPVTALGAVVTPALQGLMSKRAPDDRQGELQGAITSVKALALMASPVVMTQVFALFTAPPGLYLPGAPFLLSAALVAACLALWITRPRMETA